VAGLCFSTVIGYHHAVCPKSMPDDEKTHNWAYNHIVGTITTVNLSPPVQFILGHFALQIEHHLLPKVPLHVQVCNRIKPTIKVWLVEIICSSKLSLA
jgi:fatty acid desaturase